VQGSLVGREVKYDEIKNNPYMVMKDLNWIKMNRRLMLGPEKAKWFLEQMQKDVDLLLRLNVMDYSLLLGIHYLKRGNSENIRDKSLCVFDVRQCTYVYSIE
jgi:1-phosphatidylinositol-4-phosphate 5-kinase